MTLVGLKFDEKLFLRYLTLATCTSQVDRSAVDQFER